MVMISPRPSRRGVPGTWNQSLHVSPGRATRAPHPSRGPSRRAGASTNEPSRCNGGPHTHTHTHTHGHTHTHTHGAAAAITILLRVTAWCLAVWFMAGHVFGAAAARWVLARATPLIPKVAARACSFDWLGEIGDRDVIVINDPTVLSSMAPFDRAYLRRPLPKTIRNLIPGSMTFEVNRLDASTLVLKAKQSDLFDCPAVGRLHPCYACKSANEFLFGEKIWRAGERVTNSAFVAEILSVSARGAPRAIAFHFDKPLESEEKVWLYFDWGQWSHARFVLPKLGESVEIAGGQPL